MELELGKPCPWCGPGSMVFDGGAAGYFCDQGFECKGPRPWNNDPSIGAMKEFAAPRHLRKGQALFAFLVWLDTHKKVSSLRIDDRNPWTIANPFYIEDDVLAKWWDEWVESLDGDAE